MTTRREKAVISFLVTMIAITCVGGVCMAAERTSSELALARDGATDYSIVISDNAPEGIKYAARELAYFLKEMTGADLPIVGDSAPKSEQEIVLGETNRKRLSDLPSRLQPKVLEGFAILPEKKRLFIIGRITRGTLYGVYDFLEQELGVRFLTPKVNHIPKLPTLELQMKPRRYDPPMEYRNGFLLPGAEWAVRNRFNGHWSMVPMANMLGGVRWVGPSFVHTFDFLVPVAEYFDTHPEYFSMIGGKRVKEYDGLITQLCLTNPDVLRISKERVRQWIKSGMVHPDDKLIVSVTVNDSANHCQCSECVAVNRAEGVKEGGALIRFVNAIAGDIQSDYPNVSVETLGYAGTQPTKTAPASNVIIRWVGSGDWSVPMEKLPDSYKQLLQWEKLIGDGHLYTWFNLKDTSEYLYPEPNLRYIDRNIRTLIRHRVNGIFALSQQGPGTDVHDIRMYLLAKCIWRPDTNGRRTIEEFCRLYYGKGAPDVLKYVDFHEKQKRGSFSGKTLQQTDDILARAEAKAESPEVKLRVAALRLQPWRYMLGEAFGREGRLVEFPVEWNFRFDADERGIEEGWAKATEFDSNWRKMRIDKHWTQQGEERRGVAWYATPFEAPDTKDAPLALSFDAVDGDCEVFVDGKKVGERTGIPLEMCWQHHFYTPLQDGLAPGRHVLAVRVIKRDYSAGIWKPISLVDLSSPISPDLRSAGERFIEVSKAIGMTHLSEYYSSPWGIQMDKVFYPSIETFLKHRR